MGEERIGKSFVSVLALDGGFSEKGLDRRLKMSSRYWVGLKDSGAGWPLGIASKLAKRWTPQPVTSICSTHGYI